MEVINVLKINYFLARIFGMSTRVVVSNYFAYSKIAHYYSLIILFTNSLFQITYLLDTTISRPIENMERFLASLDFWGFMFNSTFTTFMIYFNDFNLCFYLAQIKRIHIEILKAEHHHREKLYLINNFLIILGLLIAFLMTFFDTIGYYLAFGNSGFFVFVKFGSMLFRSFSHSIIFILLTIFVFIIGLSYDAINNILMILQKPKSFKRKQLMSAFSVFNYYELVEKLQYVDYVLKEFSMLVNTIFSVYGACLSGNLFFELLYTLRAYIYGTNQKWYDHVSSGVWVLYFGSQFIGCIVACEYTKRKVWL